MNEKDVVKVYEALLCSPGMDVLVKLDNKICRKTILLLSQVVSRGLSKNGPNDQFGLIEVMDEQSQKALKELVQTTLENGGLTDLDKMLRSLNPS